MNFKRKRSKSARAGCLLCKPWKVMGNSKEARKPKDRVFEKHISLHDVIDNFYTRF